MTTKKLVTVGENGKAIFPTLDTGTGERGVGEFDMDTLCRLGYGLVRMDDIVVLVETKTARVI